MKGEKKILIIAPLPPPYNGQSIAVETLLNSKLSQIFKISVVNLSGKGRTGKSGEFSVFRMLQLLNLFLVVLYRYIIWKPRMTYLTISQSSLGFLRDVVFVNISNIFNVPIVVHLHGGDFGNFYEKSNKLLQFLIKNTLDKVNRIIVLDNSLKYIVGGITKRDKILVICNCVQKKTIPSKQEVQRKLKRLKKLPAKTPSLKILYFSNLIRTKGYFDLLKAVEILNHQGITNIHINLAGEFPDNREEQYACEFVSKHKLTDKVKFYGVVTGRKKKQLFIENDILALPTYYPQEGQPISIIEAMCSGMPIIATKYRAIPSIMTEDRNGFFVPPKSPDMIAEAIIKFLKEPTLIYKMGQENFRKAHDEFKEEKYIEKLVKLFEEVLK